MSDIFTTYGKPDPQPGADFFISVPEWYWDIYYLAFGKMMREFARVEDHLNFTVARILNELVYPQKYRRAPFRQDGRPDIFSGQRESFLHLQRAAAVKAVAAGLRMAPARDTLKRFLRLQHASAATMKEVNDIFGHLAEIQYVRDRLAHNDVGVHLKDREGWFSSSNEYSAREGDKVSTIFFKPPTILDMHADLSIMRYRLEKVIEPDFSRENFKGEPWTEILGPWRYKPSNVTRKGPRDRPDLPK